MLAGIPNLDLALTTIGSLLTDKAQSLADAGLKRIIVRLLRVSVVAAVGIWVARRQRSRQAPPEGHWQEGISGNGVVSGDRR